MTAKRLSGVEPYASCQPEQHSETPVRRARGLKTHQETVQTGMRRMQKPYQQGDSQRLVQQVTRHDLGNQKGQIGVCTGRDFLAHMAQVLIET